MSFIETEASVRYEVIDGKKVAIITPQCKVTLTNMITKKKYKSDSEALADVQDPNSDTKPEHVRRDVDITVESIPLGAGVNIF